MYKSISELNFDKECKFCNLHEARRTYIKDKETKELIKVDPGAVAGAGPEDLTKVKLIVISDHPSFNEEKVGYPMYSNEVDRLPTRKQSLLGWQTAGAILRAELSRMFGLDTYSDCYFTNIIKCNNREVTILDNHIDACINRWLRLELDILDDFIPKCPILIAGSKATVGFTKILAPANFPATSIPDLRLTPNLFYKLHPVFFTINPVAVANCIMRLEVNNNPRKAMELKPLYGSPLWLFRQDLEQLQPYIT